MASEMFVHGGVGFGTKWWEQYKDEEPAEEAAAAEKAAPEAPPEAEKKKPEIPSDEMLRAMRYIKKGTLESLKKAIPLLKTEAENGNVEASGQGAEVCIRVAAYLEDQEAFVPSMEMWNQALQFLNLRMGQLTDAEEDEEKRKKTVRLLEQALYGAATCYWTQGSHKAVIDCLLPIEHRNAKCTTLLALSMACRAKTAAEVPDVMAQFASVFDNARYASASGVGKAKRMEQVIFATAARTYADWMSKGAGGAKPNPGGAAIVTKTAFYAVTDDTAKKVLQTKK